jgi:hypothetical protein
VAVARGDLALTQLRILLRFTSNIARAIPAKPMSSRGKSGRVELLLELSPTVLVGAGVTPEPALLLAAALAEAPALAAALAEAPALAAALAEAPALAAALAEAPALALAAALADALAISSGEVKHVFVIALLIKDTSPFRASARPCTVAPSAIVMDVRAMIVPMKVEPDPRVAELMTCQKTLHELAPRMRFTELPDAVTRDEVAWKIQTEFGSFWPSSITVPVRSRTTPPAL